MPDAAPRLKVQVILFTGESPRRYLALRYNEQKGGYWQPVTGSVEEGETLEEAALREAREETGIRRAADDLVPSGYTFDFHSFGHDRRETVFGLRVPTDVKVVLSGEHVEFRWGALHETLTLYRWDSNKRGLRALAARLDAMEAGR